MDSISRKSGMILLLNGLGAKVTAATCHQEKLQALQQYRGGKDRVRTKLAACVK